MERELNFKTIYPVFYQKTYYFEKYEGIALDMMENSSKIKHDS